MEQTESSDDSLYLTASEDEEEDSDTEDKRTTVLHNLFEQSTINMAGEIELWKFGQTTCYKKILKTATVHDVLSTASKSIYGANVSDISLFHQYRIIEEYGNIYDHVGSSIGPAKIFIIQNQTTRNPECPWTSQPDMINQWEEDSRVKMSCGHAITPENLFTYCLRSLRNGYCMFTCPAIPDPDKNDQCGQIWDFTEVRQKACLSNDEGSMFEMMLSYNKIQQIKDVYFCPTCGKFIESACSQNGYCVCQGCDAHYGGTYKFCIFCLQPWGSAAAYGNCGNGECIQSLIKRREILSKCETKVIVDVPNCPIVRACPVCHYMIQHEEDVCKHMECPSIHCKAKFCFICLKIKTDKYYWPCGGAFDKCNVAPRQTL